ncbi:head-tail adaptor protein [Lactiplantibacillus plantarum]|nr:head-tail adaptor protein [Lactiplantibacillus plantarum]MCG0915491.1 head-tail adaptor protein [Lactiplantibacillus plantarum]
MKIELERLKHKGVFNKQGYQELPNGNVVNTNEKLFDFWYGYYKQSLSQSVSSNAFDFLKDKVTIVARHSDYFVQAMSDTSYAITLPAPNNKTYHVASINPDYEVNGYDTIVLSAVGTTTTTGTTSNG